MIQKQELIDSIERWAPGKTDRKILDGKSVDQLKDILAAAVTAFTEEQEDRLLEIQADIAANRAAHQLRLAQATEPQRQEEAADQEKENRRVFASAAKELGFSSSVDANFSVLVSALETLSVSGIRQFLSANPMALVGATELELQQHEAERIWELQQREAERIRQHNQMLLNADPITLKRLAQEEAEARRAQAQRVEAERQIAARESTDAAFGFPPLPEVNQMAGEKIDAAYLTQISNTNMQLFRNYIRKHGAANVTARLRGIR